ncbi:MAG: hypothetical protein AB7W37_15885 [Syntrophobacteraceae bacterium]
MLAVEADRLEESYFPSLETAKVMLKDYFEHHHGKVVDYVDLTTAFHIPLHLIVQACEVLEKEGQIAGVD